MTIVAQQGWTQQTPAVMQTLRRAMGGTARASGRKRRKVKKVLTQKKKRVSAKRTGKKGRLVKGSAAAKAWGRKMKAAKKK